MKALSKKLLLQLVNGIREPVMVVDTAKETWKVAFYNPAMLRLIGLTSGEVSQQDAEPLLFRLAGSAATAALKDCQGDRPRTSFESQYVRADAPDRAIDGEVVQAVGYKDLLIVYLRVKEVSSESANQNVVESGVLKQLESTGSFVAREPWMDLLVRDAAIAAREQVWLAVILFRVDAFDTYVDTFGQHAGESAVKRISHSIRRRLKRAGDSATRLSDDEIAVVVHGSTAPAAREFADSIAEDIRALAIHHPRSPHGKHLSVSIGVCAEVPSVKDGAVDSMLGRARTQLDQSIEPIHIMGSLTAH
ncbi:MAG: GGDEF domain-containing protein [Woeseiaceae bacterium]